MRECGGWGWAGYPLLLLKSGCGWLQWEEQKPEGATAAPLARSPPEYGDVARHDGAECSGGAGVAVLQAPGSHAG